MNNCFIWNGFDFWTSKTEVSDYFSSYFFLFHNIFCYFFFLVKFYSAIKESKAVRQNLEIYFFIYLNFGWYIWYFTIFKRIRSNEKRSILSEPLFPARFCFFPTVAVVVVFKIFFLFFSDGGEHSTNNEERLNYLKKRLHFQRFQQKQILWRKRIWSLRNLLKTNWK